MGKLHWTDQFERIKRRIVRYPLAMAGEALARDFEARQGVPEGLKLNDIVYDDERNEIVLTFERHQLDETEL